MTKPTRTRAEAVHDALLEAKSDVDHAFAQAIKRHEPPVYVPPEQHNAFEAARTAHLDRAFQGESTKGGHVSEGAGYQQRQPGPVKITMSPGGQPDLSPGDNAIHTAIKAGRYFLDRMDDEVSLGVANRGALRACFDALVAEVDRIHPLLALAEVDRQDLATLRKRIAELEAQANTDAAEIHGLKGDVRTAERAYEIAIEQRDASRAALPEYIKATDRLFRYFSEITGYQIRQSDPIGTRVDTLTRFVHEIEDSRRSRVKAAEAAHEATRLELQGFLDRAQTAALEWKARPLKAEAAAKPIEVPLLPASYPDALAGMIRENLPFEIKDAATTGHPNRRWDVAQALATLFLDSLRHLGAENAPAAPPSAMRQEWLGQFVDEMAEAMCEKTAATRKDAFKALYPFVEDAVRDRRITIAARTRSRAGG